MGERRSWTADQAVSVRVYFLDNTFSTYTVSPSESILALRERVARTLRMPPAHARAFELYCSLDGANLGPELPGEMVASRVKQGSRLVYAARMFCDDEVMGGGNNPQQALLPFRRQRRGSMERNRRKTTLRLAFAQAVFAVNSGRYYCDVETAVRLAALQCRVAHEHDILTADVVEARLPELVPRPLAIAASKTKDEWTSKIMDALKVDDQRRRHEDASSSSSVADGSRVEYLEVVERWRCYGVTLFVCAELALFRIKDEDSKLSRKPTVSIHRDVAVGVSQDTLAVHIPGASSSSFGSRFFDPSSRCVAYKLTQVKRWGYKPGFELYFDIEDASHLAMELGLNNKTSPRLKPGSWRVMCATSEGARVASLLRDYALHKLRPPVPGDDKFADEEEDKEPQPAAPVKPAVKTSNWRDAAHAVLISQSMPAVAMMKKRASISFAEEKKKKKRHERFGSVVNSADALSATKIEALWRGFSFRVAWLREDCALAIQGVWRGAATRWAIERDETAVLLQSLARGYLTRLAIRKERRRRRRDRSSRRPETPTKSSSRKQPSPRNEDFSTLSPMIPSSRSSQRSETLTTKNLRKSTAVVEPREQHPRVQMQQQQRQQQQIFQQKQRPRMIPRPRSASVQIQRHWRGYHVRRDLASLEQDLAVVQIQAMARGKITRDDMF